MERKIRKQARRWLARVRTWPPWWRRAVGAGMVLGGALGFLPVVGFWMLPLGLLVLSIDSPALRRGRRRLTLWWARRGR